MAETVPQRYSNVYADCQVPSAGVEDGEVGWGWMLDAGCRMEAG